MPGKPATVASYAAGASLAAVALIYVFGPTFTLDNEHAPNGKKKTIVGLRNAANDCFINSVLQVLAGLDDLRIYLIRETHRRRIEDPAVYAFLVQPEGTAQPLPDWKLHGLQDGLVTYGLKDMLDALNERPIYKKSVSPFPLVRVLETAFRQRISRQQQDAQEFLQIVAERLKDEYHAGRRARVHARTHGIQPSAVNGGTGEDTGDESDRKSEKASVNGVNGSNTDLSSTETTTPNGTPSIEKIAKMRLPTETEEAFPMEGKYESQLECTVCAHKSKPREETFCTLTLAVPQVSSTTLNSCFDGIFKTEHIEDFKCENCRLVQARTNLEAELAKSTSESFKKTARESIEKLTHAIKTDPENPPEDVDLGDIKYAPKRKIAKTTRMTVFPKILAIHLSRSIYGGQMTQKNSAKVSFPENLPLGGILDQRKYKLLGVVTHRGGHNSGHYEAFRRQIMPKPPFANLNTFKSSEAYSKTPTPVATPELAAKKMLSPAVSTPDLLSASSGNSSTPSLDSANPPRSVPPKASYDSSPLANGKDKDDTTSLRSVAASTKSALSRMTSPKSSDEKTEPMSNLEKQASRSMGQKPTRKKRPGTDKWWRVSDEKVKESKTSEVLGMQKEVYLLFYELDKEF